ncbi:hypothetical protein CHCC20335_3673 [Bacillus paralicheniformis]|nr:hypothetical protein CHCC20335_3673 [Bacillus paralicheniformis]
MLRDTSDILLYPSVKVYHREVTEEKCRRILSISGAHHKHERLAFGRS